MENHIDPHTLWLAASGVIWGALVLYLWVIHFGPLSLDDDE